MKATYGVNFDRLVALKTKVDPNNLFRLNANVRRALTEGAALRRPRQIGLSGTSTSSMA